MLSRLMLNIPLTLWELSVTEQKHRALLEVMAGILVTEVAGRHGASGLRRADLASLGKEQAERERITGVAMALLAAPEHPEAGRAVLLSSVSILSKFPRNGGLPWPP